MPIVERVANEADLTQGDILKGISLFVSECKDGSDPGLKRIQSSFCLVLTRPCVAIRGQSIVVAAIEAYGVKPPAAFESFDACKKFYASVRDGLTTPDNFYLGQLPGETGVYCARFDSFHTLAVTQNRQEFCKKYRVGRLHESFAHDLHQRQFRAFASLGFDDHDWFPDADLAAVIAFADREHAQAKSDHAQAVAELRLGESQGFKKEGHRSGLEGKIEDLTAQIAKLEKDSQPYRDAHAKRQPKVEAAAIP